MKHEQQPASVAPVPLLEAVPTYMRMGVGLDMTLKSAVGVFRLLMIYARSPEARLNYSRLVDSIIETRMLTNHWRYFFSLLSALRVLRSKESMPISHRILLSLSFAFRTLEQIHGDFGYYQKVFMHSWSRQRLSYGYRFWKSLSLTCVALLDTLKLLQARGKLKALRERGASNATKEETGLRAPAPVPCGRVDSPTASSIVNGAAYKVEYLLRVAKKEEYLATIGVIRSLCDMVVYYKWMSWYNPYKTVEFSAGIVSGILGAYLVWTDVRYPSLK